MLRIMIAMLGVALLLPVSASADDPLSDYREPARRILGEALLSSEPYETLAELCDSYGHRLSGSDRLEAAIDWAVERMREQGLERVRREEVMVPHWVRGEEWATLTTPTTQHELSILGLGMSVGTPEAGINAELIVVGSFEELEALGRENIEGKIVLYDVPFEGYGKTVQYRGHGASRAAALGAVAALVRSVGPMSFDTPHTGALRYDEEQPKIPAAAVTIENATLMHRLFDRGEPLRIQLVMEAQLLEEAPSANVVAEWRGRERPEEIVVVAGHFDSWDVGQGAQDDGAGCIIAWQAARILQRLDLRPRRTIRVVLYTNEENGLAGGKAYREAHREELGLHVAAIESDTGNGLANGFRVDLRSPEGTPEDDAEAATLLEGEKQDAIALLARYAPLFDSLGSTEFFPSWSGADVGPIVEQGVVGLGLNHDTTKYWEIHHTEADTFEKIVDVDLRKNVASMALMAFLLAEMPERLRDTVPAATATH